MRRAGCHRSGGVLLTLTGTTSRGPGGTLAIEVSGAAPGTGTTPTDVTLTADAPPVDLPPPDDDNDGVPNASDNCPTASGSASNGGCPPVTSPPPADDTACDTAKSKLAKAKAKLKRLRQDASKPKLMRAKQEVKTRKEKVKKACS